MKKVNKIMVAVDFSELSISAAQYAFDLAGDLSASIVICNVFNQINIDLANKATFRVPEFSVKKYTEETCLERQGRLEDIVKKLNVKNLDVDISITIGVPYEALLKEIEEKKPDLLVMGTKGKSSFADMIIGSCAQKMFRRCPVPLLSIRDTKM